MVFTFWEGDMPGYIRLCMDTWKVPYTVLNYDNLSQYTELPVEKLKRFSLPLIADAVRVHVLRDNGGYWLDADTIMVTDKLPEAVILGDPEARTNTIGMLHTKPQTDMFKEWAAYQDELINENGTSHFWAAMGNAFTDPYLQKHREIEIGRINDYWPETYMIDGDMHRCSKYLAFYFAEDYELTDIRKTDMLMLHNSWTPAWYKQLSESEALAQRCTLSNVLRELVK